LLRALPGEPGFVATIAGAMRKHPRQLDISVGMSGPHDFAVRGKHRSSAQCHRVHRIPHPTSVTIAKRPSYRGGTGESIKLFLPNQKAKYFFAQDWTGIY
jgi:hypothetical protein